ncbi:hypothetical protein PVAND_017095 [Polypedilum vanderplanki]|uniref:Uncharacterized protein n=1 Tax=Polypedilum vanderplanki TaxID=319348 RepID=A0A9J6BHL8_POLVA|nr:hypothetical protein PVAND_017095 [Polypedilum vanderplanki]
MKVNNFLCCFKLESGGTFIGFAGLFVYGLSLPLYIFGLVAIIISEANCSMQQKYATIQNDFGFACAGFYSIIPIIIYLLAILVCILGCFASFKLIKGIENHDTSYLNFAVRFHKFLLTMELLSLTKAFRLPLSFTISLIIAILLDLYIIIIINSIINKFNNLPKRNNENTSECV